MNRSTMITEDRGNYNVRDGGAFDCDFFADSIPGNGGGRRGASRIQQQVCRLSRRRRRGSTTMGDAESARPAIC